jgi:hypothetical protein
MSEKRWKEKKRKEKRGFDQKDISSTALQKKHIW